MKRILWAIVIITAISVPALAEKGNPPEKTKAIVTAIDVAELMKGGAADADIAESMSLAAGFDRESSLKGGQTDLQIIIGLISGPYDAKREINRDSAITHKFDGDKYLKSSQYDKAANEYTLAIRCSEDNFALYKSRGDSYRQYLSTTLSPTGTGEGPQKAWAERARKVLCAAINSDYVKAERLNNETMKGVEERLIVLKDNMTNRKMTDLSKSDVAPYHYRAAGNIQSMREMDRLYRAQRLAKSNDLELKKAMKEYRKLCGKDDPLPKESKDAEKKPKRIAK